MNLNFETARIKKLYKLISMYKKKIYISRLVSSLGFGDDRTFEEWFIDLDLPEIQINIDTNTIEYSELTIKELENKIINIEKSAPKIEAKFSLNEKQKEAVKHINGPALVIAGAGSGKTMTLSYRVANLVDKGINPKNILLLTFTRKSAQEMLSRASKIAKIDLKNVAGGTFHSFANLVLRKYASKFELKSNFTIINQITAEDTLKLLATNLGYTDKDKMFPKKSIMMDIISKSRNKQLSLGQVLVEEYNQYIDEQESFNILYNVYQKYKRQHNIVDYDDLLVYLKLLLQTDEQVRKKIADQYKYVMVDEYQDTNKIQADLVYWLAKEHNNIMVVGDDAQSIYSFRGANFKNILNFREYFPDYKEIKLEISYRSLQPILDFSNALLKPAKEITPRTLVSIRSQEEKGTKPKYWRFNSIIEEADHLVSEILNLRSNSLPLNEIAVLVRNAYHAREIERVCTKKRIPYVFYGGRRWSELAHIQDLMSYLRILYDPSDIVAWQRILLLLPGVGNKTSLKLIEKLQSQNFKIDTLKSSYYVSRKYFDDLVKLADVLIESQNEKLKLSKRISLLIEYYEPFLEQKKNPSSRKADLTYLKQKSREFKKLEELLNELALTPPTEKIEVKGVTLIEDEKPLVISTIHSAKGLEWQVVFVARVVDGQIPSDKSVLIPEQLEEERRLFYVAVTRAKDYLYLTSPHNEKYAKNYYMRDSINYVDESRFLSEMSDLDNLVDKNKFMY